MVAKGQVNIVWKMETPREEKDYLVIEAEIWPDTPLGLNRLSEYKNKKLWTSMVLRQSDAIVSGLSGPAGRRL